MEWFRSQACGKLTRRFVVACVLALAALVCAPGAMASTPKSSTKRLSAIHSLSAKQFAAVERVYIAMLPLDDVNESTPEAELNATMDATVRACFKLSKRDPLLRAMRVGCPAISEFPEALAAYNTCLAIPCLKLAVKSARAAMRRMISSSRINDRAVKATHLPARCKRALLTSPEDYAQVAKTEEALATLQRGLTTGSLDELAAGEEALNRALMEDTSSLTAKQILQRFRSACR